MTSISTCPELQELAKFVLRQSSSKEAETIARHMDECDRCLATVDSLKGGARRLPAVAALAQPAAQLVQPSLDEVEVALPTKAGAQVRPSKSVAANRQSKPAGVAAELPSKSTSLARLVFGFALVAAVSFVCFFYASDIARFFQRTMSQ